jgi:hypothetical protein
MFVLENKMTEEIKDVKKELEKMNDFEKALTHYCGELLRNASEFENTKNRSKRKKLVKEAKSIKNKLNIVTSLIKNYKTNMDENK